MGALSSALSIKCQKFSVPRAASLSTVSSTTRMCRTDVSWSRIFLASFLRKIALVVMSTSHSPMLSRVAIGSGPNAENNGDTTLPLRSAPMMLM